MKKVLVRSGMSQLDTFDAVEIIKRGSIGTNVGNLIYPFSIYRNLYSEEVELVSDYYRNAPDDADLINENYSAYVLPLANGIRASFVPTLRRYTELFNKLEIPVYIIGLGLKDHFVSGGSKGFPFDDDVRNFIKAVLKKSSMIGLRGQTTADYLSYLGFRDGIDHQAIGCPSMYTFGSKLKIRDFSLSDDSVIYTNMTSTANQNALEFMNRITEQYKNATFVPQELDELVLTYLGTPYFNGLIRNGNLSNYPNSINSRIYKEGKVKYFLNAKTWIEEMKGADLSIGTRLHGNIAPTLAGTPTITIPIDERMNELCRFHNFPTIAQEKLDNTTELADLIAQVDFKSVEKTHEENFKNFLEFLNKNGIEHGYNNAHNEQPFDRELARKDIPAPLVPITSCQRDEMVARIEGAYEVIRKRIDANERGKAATIVRLKKKVSQLREKVAQQDSAAIPRKSRAAKWTSLVRKDKLK